MELKYLTKHVGLKLAQGCCPSFQLSHQENPCYRCLVKIHQEEGKVFNKACSLEVSIGLLSLISIVSSKESLLEKFHENPSTWSPAISQKMQFSSQHRVFTPHFDHLANRPLVFHHTHFNFSFCFSRTINVYFSDNHFLLIPFCLDHLTAFQ